MAPVNIIEVNLCPPSPERLRWFVLDNPKVGSNAEGATVRVGGRALTLDGPIPAVELTNRGRVFERSAVDKPRPGLAARFPQIPGAGTAGFWFQVRFAGMEEQEWGLQAVLRDQSRLPLATIRLRRNWGEGAEPGPLVSVVIPCYRQAHFLGEAIESVLGQSYPHVEVVVVDDGSPDNVAAVAGRYPGVRYERQENRGLAGARNAGFRFSGGSFVVFLDSDDRLLPEAIKTGLACLSEHPECAMAIGHHRNISPDGSPLPTSPQRYFEKDHYLALLRHNLCMPAAVFYRRGALEQVGGFDEAESPSADYDMYLRIARDFPVHCHRNQVAEYRIHGSNMTRDEGLILRSTVHVLRKQWPHAKKKKETRAAYREGMRFGREHYGKLTAKTVTWDLHDGRWKKAWQGLRTLLHYYRAGIPLRYSPSGACDPPLGKVDFRKLRTLAPVSRMYGLDRGRPIDRYYIEKFLARHAADVHGRVLEIGDNVYTRQYGGSRVSRSDVLHVEEGNPRATIVADLAEADQVPSESFDCIIFTQTLQYIYDAKTAVRALYRLLKPGGVLLASVPGISPIITEAWCKGFYWKFTRDSARRLFGEVFGAENVRAKSHGNVLVAISFLHGLATEDLQPDELDHADSQYQLVITLRAVKPETKVSAGGGVTSTTAAATADPKALILMYHRVAELSCDPWLLGVTPEHFAEHLEILQREARPISLRQWAEGAGNGALPERSVVITFDDGYADNFLNARPALEKLGIPATFFLTTGLLGSQREYWWDQLQRLLLEPGRLPSVLRLAIGNRVHEWDLGSAAEYSAEEYERFRRWCPWEAAPMARQTLYASLYQLLNPMVEGERNEALEALRTWAGAGADGRESHRVMTSEEVQTMARGDLLEVGAHTVTHPCLAAQPPGVQRQEILQSKACLEELIGRPVTSFAYPYGRLLDYTETTVSFLKEAGFARACARFAGVVRRASDHFQLPRMTVVNWDGATLGRKLAEWFQGG